MKCAKGAPWTLFPLCADSAQASPVEITDVVSKVNRRLNALKNEKKIDKAEPPKFTTAGPGGAANGDKSSPATETVEKETSASEQDTAASAAGQDKGEEVKPVEEEASVQQAAAEEKEAEGNSEAKAEAENSEGVWTMKLVQLFCLFLTIPRASNWRQRLELKLNIMQWTLKAKEFAQIVTVIASRRVLCQIILRRHSFRSWHQLWLLKPECTPIASVF